MLPKDLDKYVAGATVVDPAFSSAGKSRRVSDIYMNYEYPFMIPNELKVTFTIESKTSKDVSSFGKFEGLEEEVIFDRNTKYEVVSKVFNGKFYEIRLREI